MDDTVDVSALILLKFETGFLLYQAAISKFKNFKKLSVVCIIHVGT